MGGNATFNVSPAGTQTIAGTIAESSPSSVLVTGGGSLVLSGNNTYSGGTTINGGTLVAAALADASGNATFRAGSSVIVNTGGTLQLNGADSLGYFSGSPILNIIGGTITTDGSASHSNLGAVNMTGGTLTASGNGDVYGNYILDATINSLASAAAATISGPVLSIRNEVGHVGGGFSVARGAAAVDLTVSSNIINLAAESGALTKTGSGILALTGTSTFTGGTIISAGTLQLGNGGSSGSVVGNITNNGALAFNRSDTVIFIAAISGSGTVAQNGSGTVVLSTANAYTGGTMINAGTLDVKNFGLPATSIVINSSPGTLQYDTSGGNINQLRADLSGTGKLVKTGGGQLLFGNAGDNAINWNFSPGTLIDIQGGTFVGGTSVNDFWTNDNASLNIAAGATFSGVEANVQIDALTGAGTFTGGYAFGGVETIGIAGGSGIFSGSLQDTLTGSGYDLSIVKVGTGTETLSGVSTFSGSTTVNNGTLVVTSTGALGSGPLAVNAANGITSIASFSNNQTISALSGSVAGTGSARVNVLGGGTLTANQSTSTVFAGSVMLASGPTSATAGALVKSNTRTLEIDGGLSLGNNSALTVSGGKLRLSISGSASVGSGVTANITGGSVLELAGTVSALGTTVPANRVAITNSSIAGDGLLVSAGNQQVGGIGGTGSTQVNAGASLTADHIIQTALIIGGTTGSDALVTIAASDVSGNPLGSSSGFACAGSLTPSDPFGAGDGIGSTNPSGGDNTDLAAVSLGNSATGDNPAAVPEPSTLLLILIAVSGVIGRRLR